jgi:hypothetical protein
MSLKAKIDKWFSQNYSYLQKEVKGKIAVDSMSEYAGDLLSVCTESFLTRSPEQQQQMLDDDKIGNYILYCCGFQLKSGSSPFYNQFRKHKFSVRSGWEGLDDRSYERDLQLDETELYQCYKQARSEMHWYYNKLLEMKWDDGLSYAQIREKTGITLNSVQKDISLAYNIIRQKCSHCI